jgi:hypothetical protein
MEGVARRGGELAAEDTTAVMEFDQQQSVPTVIVGEEGEYLGTGSLADNTPGVLCPPQC